MSKKAFYLNRLAMSFSNVSCELIATNGAPIFALVRALPGPEEQSQTARVLRSQEKQSTAVK